MFIVSPTKGGYRGDVNTAFRQGRKDAYDDYIDAYNTALKADMNTYNFNQKVVADTADNYRRQNAMAKSARDEALSFINGSGQIQNAQYAFDVNKNRLDMIYEQNAPSKVGKSIANTQMNDVFTGEVKSDTGYTVATQDNTITKKYGEEIKDAKSQEELAGTQSNTAIKDLTRQFTLANNKALFEKTAIDNEVKNRQRSGDNRSPSEIEYELRSDSTFMDNVEQERQSVLTNTQEAIRQQQQIDPKKGKSQPTTEELFSNLSSEAIGTETDQDVALHKKVENQFSKYKISFSNLEENRLFRLEPNGPFYRKRGGALERIKTKNDKEYQYVLDMANLQDQRFGPIYNTTSQPSEKRNVINLGTNNTNFNGGD